MVHWVCSCARVCLIADEDSVKVDEVSVSESRPLAVRSVLYFTMVCWLDRIKNLSSNSEKTGGHRGHGSLHKTTRKSIWRKGKRCRARQQCAYENLERRNLQKIHCINFNRFNVRQHRPICRARYMLRPFVCPSVTCGSPGSVKTVEVRIMQFSPYSNPIPLVFAG